MKNPLTVPSRESSNVTQLSALLAITHSLQAYLILPPQPLGESLPPALDGGAVTAAATTFIKTCGKIDELLEDKSRWSLETQDALYDALIQTNEYQQRFLHAQTDAAKSIVRPAFQLRPTLILAENGYIAIHGNLTDPGAVIGSGPTPEAALLDFDAAFQRLPKDQKVLIPTEEILPPVESVTKRKKKK